MKNNRKTKSSVILRVAIFAVSVYMVVTFCGLWGKLIDSQNEFKNRQAVRDELNADIENLTAVLEGSHSEIIEKEARRLGYAYPGEQIYTNGTGIN